MTAEHTLLHVGPPSGTPPAPLPSVRTREDCLDWLNEDDVQVEVWAAFRGACRYIRDHDFEPDVLDMSSVTPPKGLIPGTVLCEESGQAWVGRHTLLEVLVTGLAWRLEALAQRRGVDLAFYDRDFNTPLRDGQHQTAAQALADQTYLGKYMGGEVTQYHFKSKREAQAWMKAHNAQSPKKDAPAAATNSSRAVTNIDRSNADGTNCRA